MYAVVRSYTGAGANELFVLLAQRKREIEQLMRSISGFVTYTIFQTDEGGVTVTVCQDRAGTDKSTEVARDWIQKNASHSGTSLVVSEGPVVLMSTIFI